MGERQLAAVTRVWVLALAIVVVAAGCTSSNPDSGLAESSSSDVIAAPGADLPDEPNDCAAAGTAMTLGVVLPAGELLGAPSRLTAAQLAIEDVNAAGGVFRAEMTAAIRRTEGDDDLAVHVDDLIENESPVAIMTITSSASALAVLNDITGSGIIQVSPNNTSSVFTASDTRDLYFRTAPSDVLQGRVLSDEFIGDGHTTASVIYRNDSYGTGLFDSFRENFEAAERRVIDSIPFDGSLDDLDASIESLTAGDPDAVLVIGYSPESADILAALDAAGSGPADGLAVWGVDANSAVAAELGTDGQILEGMRQTVPSSNLAEVAVSEFLDRVEDALDGEALSASFTPETYDAVIILALAALSAGCDNNGGIASNTAIASNINDVTRGGQKCFTFRECKQLVADGVDIDFDGVGGSYEFTDAGEPSVATFRIDTYGASGPDPGLASYVFGRTCTVCQVNRFPEITFPPGSAEIAPEVNSTLNRVAEVLRRPGIGLVEIQGFASPEGSAEENLILSQLRADAVEQYLVDQGVPKERLQATGFGATTQFPQNRVVVFEEIG